MHPNLYSGIRVQGTKIHNHLAEKVRLEDSLHDLQEKFDVFLR